MYVSLKDVAARAGVSFQTASKVLRGRSGVVSDDTRARILSAADDIGYVPNALARGLVSQATTTIGILVDDLTDPAVATFVQAAERAAAADGHSAVIVTARPGADPSTAVRSLQEQRVGGILVVAPRLENEVGLGAALRGRLPVVSINHVHGGGVTLIGSDHSLTGKLAAEHLVGLGHRRVGTVTGPRGRRVVRARQRGFRGRLEGADVPLRQRCVVEADWTPAGGRDAARRLVDAEPGLTAIFVHNDAMALGVLHALREVGRRVPRDCSLVGCDDLGPAPFLSPPLTTVHVPFAETGARAAGALLQRLRDEPTADHDLLPVHLVVRESSAPPPAQSPVPVSK